MGSMTPSSIRLSLSKDNLLADGKTVDRPTQSPSRDIAAAWRYGLISRNATVCRSNRISIVRPSHKIKMFLLLPVLVASFGIVLPWECTRMKTNKSYSRAFLNSQHYYFPRHFSTLKEMLAHFTVVPQLFTPISRVHNCWCGPIWNSYT